MKIFFSAIISFLLTTGLCLANNEIKLAAPYITGLIEKDGSGYYQKIVSEALSNEKLNVKQQFYPYNRALNLFKENSYDCIYSLTKVLQEELGEDRILYSFPLGAFAYYIFSPKDKPPISSSSDIVDKRIGGVIGHDNYYKDALDKRIELSLAYSDSKNIQLLELNRIDYLIGALPDLNAYIDELNYVPTKPLVQSFDRITCHANDTNKQFLNTLSVQLKKMKEQGRYKEIDENFYLEF
jgi:ABC-type amino acid transport substrate-binding protein